MTHRDTLLVYELFLPEILGTFSKNIILPKNTEMATVQSLAIKRHN